MNTDPARVNAPTDLGRALVAAFLTNERFNQVLLDLVSPEIWRRFPPSSRRRNIATSFAHVHNVRCMRLKMSASEAALPERLDRSEATPVEARRALAESASAMVRLIERALEAGGRPPGYRPDVVSMVCAAINHEAHHRGEICHWARELGKPLSPEQQVNLWDWHKHWKGATGTGAATMTAGPAAPDAAKACDPGRPGAGVALKGILWPEFGAAIDMLESALLACPEELWGDSSRRPQFRHVVYHTLFWLDLYLSGSVEGFAPPAPFGLEELDPAGLLPNRIYTKEELRTYLAQGREKCRATIEALTDEMAARRCVFGWGEASFAELLLYNMRHVQHHAGQLYLVLRQASGSAPPWVARSKAGPGR